jgi:lipopolysaccharide export system permease protein
MDMLKAVQHRIARDIVVTFFVSHFVITMLVMLIDVDREAMKR